MSVQIFPTLKGLGWDIQHDIDWGGNTVTESVSGKRTAVATWTYPRHLWQLSYGFLRATPDAAEYQTLVGFFNAMRGMFGTFLYKDQTDNAVAGQQLGIGDGVTTAFQLVRAFGGFLEPCFAPAVVSKVAVNGITQAGWAASPYGSAAPGVLTLASPPPVGQAITTDFSFYFPCRFDNPKLSLKNFTAAIYSADGVSFSSEK